MRIRVILASSCLASGSLAQNIVINGSFETPAAGGSFVSRSGSFGAGNGWSIGGAIDHIGGFWAAADGGQSVDLNSASAGSVFQSLPTVPGRVYRIRYAISENLFGYEDKHLTVSWGGNIIDNLTVVHDATRTTTSMKWVYRVLFAQAPGANTTLAFTSTTGSMPGSQGNTAFYGPALDDVSVEQAPGCVGDLNGDSQVDDADFVFFVASYNVLDCNDPAMTPGCPSDFNADGFVDDADFGLFVVAYNDLVCP